MSHRDWATELNSLYDAMFKRFGPQGWWPGDSAWEICVGAVLTQNTNWVNVEKAVANLREDGILRLSALLSAPIETIENAIRPSGYFRLKTIRLLAVADWWRKYVVDDGEGGVAVMRNRSGSLAAHRQRLLTVKGVGPETADSILLYAFNLPTFVIDNYTKRIMCRHYGLPESVSYDDLRALFMGNLPCDAAFFNEYHALFVATAKHCCGRSACGDDCPAALAGMAFK